MGSRRPSPAPPSFASVSEIPRLIDVKEAKGHGMVPLGVRQVSGVAEPRLLLRPHRHHALRSEDPALAESWRSAVGLGFQGVFDQSYPGGPLRT